MAMKSIYEVLKEKEADLQELQRLLNEAQAVLNRVLEPDGIVSSERPLQANGTTGGAPRSGRSFTGPWGGNGSTEFP